MEMLDKIIVILAIILFLKIAYSLVSKVFLGGMKIKKIITWVLNKVSKKKGGG